MSETNDEKQEVNAEEEKNEADLICAPIQIIIPVVSEEEEEEEEVVEVKKKKKKKKGPSRAQKINALKSTLFQALRLVNEAKMKERQREREEQIRQMAMEQKARQGLDKRPAAIIHM